MSTNVVAALVGVASVAAFAGEAAAQAQTAPLTREEVLTRALVDDPSGAAVQGVRSGVCIGADRAAPRFYHRALALAERLSGKCAEEITQ